MIRRILLTIFMTYSKVFNISNTKVYVVIVIYGIFDLFRTKIYAYKKMFEIKKTV